jgi:hypothetical protein
MRVLDFSNEIADMYRSGDTVTAPKASTAPEATRV